MNNTPYKITVIIPTYKPQEYLWECLDSMLEQTLPKEDYQVIIVLNGDRQPYEAQITTALQEKYQTLHTQYLYSSQAGVSRARNLALEAAQGEYIAFIDDDDYVSPHYLAELYKNATPQTIALSYTKAFHEKGQYVPYRITNEYHRAYSEQAIPLHAPKKYYSGACMKLIHRDIIGHRRFNPALSSGEDALFMFLISDRAAHSKFTPQTAIYYRRFRAGSAIFTTRGNFLARARHAAMLIRSYSAIYLRHPRRYRLHFYLTRMLGAIKGVVSAPTK
ncbi:MAG: glycosyltransferase family 2 protein [Bacteroidaceae bacterium]|nr:glycosyltransferase family 2 protein [Bacteroidaceae bacterium]